MKLFYIALIPLFLNTCRSNTNDKNSQQMQADSRTSDTLVIVNDAPSYTEYPNYIAKEYYVVNKRDTSLFSCFVIENRISKTILIMVKYFPDGRANLSAITFDSLVEVAKAKKQDNNIQLISYYSFIKQLRLIFNTASKKFNLSKMKSFSFRLGCISELTNFLSQQSISKYRTSINNIGTKELESLLIKSRLTSDLNSILKPFFVSINRLTIEEFFFFPLKSKYKSYKYQDQLGNNNDGSDAIGLDGSAVFSVNSIN